MPETGDVWYDLAGLKILPNKMLSKVAVKSLRWH